MENLSYKENLEMYMKMTGHTLQYTFSGMIPIGQCDDGID